MSPFSAASRAPAPDAIQSTGLAGLSPLHALSRAVEDTVLLLFRPFRERRWIKLAIVCLFLGGGTPTAAFHWSLSSLPTEIRLSDVFVRAGAYVAQHTLLLIFAIIAGLSFAMVWLYFRATFRFVLVENILKPESALGSAWRDARPLGRSYFYWLVAALGTLGGILSLAAIATYPYLRTAAAGGNRNLFSSFLLAGGLAVVVLVGLAVTLLIMLTEDLVVPVMYAERQPLATTWRRVWRVLRAEPLPSTVYVLFRLAASVLIGLGVLFFLFPMLVAAFSGAIIVIALVLLGLHAVGLAWVWNSSTIILAVAAGALLSTFILILLSVVGMPGQVLLQDFGIRFIAPRFPSLETPLPLSSSSDELT